MSIHSPTLVEWDPAKAKANLAKHGISFAEAVTIFDDDRAITREDPMRKNRAEPYRDIDFSKGKRGPVIAPATGKTKISIRLDNAVLDHFRAIVEEAGGGNYQSLINDALVAHIHQEMVLDAVRRVVREELRPTLSRDDAADAAKKLIRRNSSLFKRLA